MYEVTGLTWERINLFLDLQVRQAHEVYWERGPNVPATGRSDFVQELSDDLPVISRVTLKGQREEFDLQWVATRSDRCRVRLRISEVAGRQFVPSGVWNLRLYFTVGDQREVATDAICSDTILMQQSDWTRVFPYEGGTRAYSVSVVAKGSDQSRQFRIYTDDSACKADNEALNPTEKTRAILGHLWYRMLRATARVSFRVYENAHLLSRIAQRHLLRRRPVCRVLLASSTSDTIGGNLAAVNDRISARGLSRELKIVFSFRAPATSSKWSIVKQLHHLAISDIVLLDDYFAPLDLCPPRVGARLVQLWHGGVGFKSVGYSRFGLEGSPSLDCAHRRYTYAIAGSTHLVDTYSEAFGIEDSAVIATGLPRTDALFDPQIHLDARSWFEKTYPKSNGKKVILFAPTFRGHRSSVASYPFHVIDFEGLYRVCGDDFVVVFHMHRFVSEKVPIPSQYSDRLIDASGSNMINNLLIVTDVLITDYSSIIYECALLNRPMLFFAFDEDEYAGSRGFHVSFRDNAPGKVCGTFDEILEAVRSCDFEMDRLDEFRRRNFGHLDGGSSDRVIDWLILGHPPVSSAVDPTGLTKLPQPSVAHHRNTPD